MDVEGTTLQWHLHTFNAEIPEGVALVIGNTGVHGSTSAMVKQVADLLLENPNVASSSKPSEPSLEEVFRH